MDCGRIVSTVCGCKGLYTTGRSKGQEPKFKKSIIFFSKDKRNLRNSFIQVHLVLPEIIRRGVNVSQTCHMRSRTCNFHAVMRHTSVLIV